MVDEHKVGGYVAYHHIIGSYSFFEEGILGYCIPLSPMSGVSTNRCHLLKVKVLTFLTVVDVDESK